MRNVKNIWKERLGIECRFRSININRTTEDARDVQQKTRQF
jgi:hypothetical protein